MTATNPSEAERQEETTKKGKKPDPKKRQVRSYMSELAQAKNQLREMELRINVAIDLLQPETPEAGTISAMLARKAIHVLQND